MRLVIVGGVAGGMSAAARFRRLDEKSEIIVLEKGEHVSYANCGLPYFISGEIIDRSKLLVQTPETLKESLNIDVRTGIEVVAIDPASKNLSVIGSTGAETISYDSLIISPGASPAKPTIPGLETANAFVLRTVPDALAIDTEVSAGVKTAAVLGAGFIGAEVAEALAMRGVATSIIEMADHILPPLETEIARFAEDALREAGVDVHIGVTASAIDGNRIKLSNGKEVKGDLLIVSAGVKPDTSVFTDAGIENDRGAVITDVYGRTNLPHVWAIGDAVISTSAVTAARRPVALAGPANRAGRIVADNIFQNHETLLQDLPALMGTAIVRVGTQTVAMTGANRQALESAGIDFDTLHTHPNHHASYFPGAKQIHMIVHFEKGNGKLLGAQAIGESGVDKRIDVIATAIKFGAKITDLIDLDLAYSPPYGSAKDPINMLGMLGNNVMSGQLQLWHVGNIESELADSLLLDVRTADEFATGHLKNAINIPHIELRERIEEVRGLAKGRRLRVMCQSGVRSYIAHRILVDAGFESASLSGGALTLWSMRPDLKTLERK